MTEYYTVKARIEKSIFSKSRLNFDVREHYQMWDDPSYGNAGGEWRDAVRTVGTYLVEHDAVDICAKLNEHNGKKPENNS